MYITHIACIADGVAGNADRHSTTAEPSLPPMPSIGTDAAAVVFTADGARRRSKPFGQRTKKSPAPRGTVAGTSDRTRPGSPAPRRGPRRLPRQLLQHPSHKTDPTITVEKRSRGKRGSAPSQPPVTINSKETKKTKQHQNEQTMKERSKEQGMVISRNRTTMPPTTSPPTPTPSDTRARTVPEPPSESISPMSVVSADINNNINNYDSRVSPSVTSSITLDVTTTTMKMPTASQVRRPMSRRDLDMQRYVILCVV